MAKSVCNYLTKSTQHTYMYTFYTVAHKAEHESVIVTMDMVHLLRQTTLILNEITTFKSCRKG